MNVISLNDDKYLKEFEILKCILLINRLRPLLHSFSIDLMDSAREWPRANILLHANVRAYVESQLSRQLVVLNAWLGAWGPERRQRTARLVPGTKVLTFFLKSMMRRARISAKHMSDATSSIILNCNITETSIFTSHFAP